MDFQPKPQSVVAVVVGVENYEIGGEWPFAGPALDAARFTVWLRSRRVPVKNIKLFLSPFPAAKHREEIAEKLATCGLSLDSAPDATEGAIWGWLEDDLIQQPGDHLVFFWSGHGAIDKNERRLFCANAKKSLHNLNFTDFAYKLRHKRYSGFTRQLLIVDTCANLYSDMQQMTSLPNHVFSGDREESATKQLVMLAAAHGEFAKQKGSERTGAFFGALYKELQAHNELQPAETEVWPDFFALFERVGNLLKSDPENFQTPVYWEIDGESKRVSPVGIPAGSTRAAPLLAALRDLGQSAAKLHPLFYRTCRNHPRVPKQPSLERMLVFPDGLARRHDETWPLNEFGIRVAREFPSNSLEAWQVHLRKEDASELATIDDRLQEEQDRVMKVTHTLVIRLDAPDTGVLHWRLQPYGLDASLPPSAEFVARSIVPSIDAQVLAETIRDIADEVDSRVEGSLAIELILSEELLVWDVEAKQLKDKRPLGAKGSFEVLGRTYPITLRWDKRAAAKLSPSMMQAWRALGQLLRRRLSNALRVEWADRRALCVAEIEKAMCRIKDDGGAPVLGLGLGIGTDVKSIDDPLLYCLSKGVPFAIWSHDTTASPKAIRKAVAAFFYECRAKDLLPRLKELRDGTVRLGKLASPSIKVLWDPPPLQQIRFAQPPEIGRPK
jgi:hypothetical protein